MAMDKTFKKSEHDSIDIFQNLYILRAYFSTHCHSILVSYFSELSENTSFSEESFTQTQAALSKEPSVSKILSSN